MEFKSLNSLKADFVTRVVGNELVIVPLSGNVAQMNSLFTLNETGKFIWENIDENTSIDDLVSKMTGEFDIDPQTARIDIEFFIKKLLNTLNA